MGGQRSERNKGGLWEKQETKKEQTVNRWCEVEKRGGGIMGHTRVHELLETGTDNDEEPEDTEHE